LPPGDPGGKTRKGGTVRYVERMALRAAADLARDRSRSGAVAV
jgi:hypothetical protein